MQNRLHAIWRGIRQLSGDDAYERYFRHYAEHHADNQQPPLSKAEFFKRWQDGRWMGLSGVADKRHPWCKGDKIVIALAPRGINN